MTTATPRRSLPSSSQAGKDKDFFLISQARNAHPCITPSPKPTPSIVKSFSLYNRRPSAFQHRQDKKRRFYGPRSISDGTPVRGSAAQKARASTSSSSGSTVPLLPRTHDTPSSRNTQSLDSASLHDNSTAPATAVTVNNRNSAPTTTQQPAINLSTSSNSTSTTPATMPLTPTVAPGGTNSPSSTTLPSIQRTPSRFFVHHPLSTTIDTGMSTASSPPSSPPKPPTTSNNSLSTVLHHHSPGNISRRNTVHGRGGAGAVVPAYATVSSAMLVPEPLRVNVGTRHVRRQGIATPPLSPPVRLRPQLQQQQQPSSSMATGTTGSGGGGSSMAFTASTQASSWSSSSAGISSSGEAAAAAATEKSQVATPRRLLFPRRAQQQKEGRGGGGGGGTYPFSSSSFLARSSMRDGKGGPGGGGKALESGGEGVGVVRRKPVSAPVHDKKMVREKKKSSASRKSERSARGESSNMDDGGVGISDDSYPEELERLEREILSLLFTNCSSSSMSPSSERKLHELGGGASSVISDGSSDEYHDCFDGYMPSSNTTTHLDRPNAQTNLRGPRPNRPLPTAPPPPLLNPHEEAQMYALMLEEEQSEDGTGHTTSSLLPISDSYARLNQTGWQSKLARKKSGEQEQDENQTLRQIIRQQRHHHHHQQQPSSPVSPPSPQLLPLPSPVPSPPPMPPRYRGRNGARQSSGPPPAMRLPDPPVRSPPRLHRSRL
ncbi:hypothetical protein BFW01_g7624 [Lasiodiplodia theobromae]|nr:hypothetical protein BFW01_g7624 [Lasiodiplodia theobromae]